MIAHDAAVFIVQVPSVFGDFNTFRRARRAAGEQEAVDVVLIQLRNLTAQFAQSEVGHTDTGERVHGGACSLDERGGLQGVG